MKYYAHYGHTEFILCLGSRGDVVKEYFLNYDECMANDFVMENGGATVHLYGSDIQDWNITFVDTGLSSTIGERLVRVRQHLKDESLFLANYSDGLTDATASDENRYGLERLKAVVTRAGHGSARSLVEAINGHKIGVIICEDAWVPDPALDAKAAGAERDDGLWDRRFVPAWQQAGRHTKRYPPSPGYRVRTR